MESKGYNKEIIFIVIALIIIVISSISVVIYFNQEEDIVLTEKELYAKLNAELACQLLEAEDLSDLTQTIEDFPELVEKYNFTLEEADELKDKYENNQNFKELVLEEVKELCPEAVDEFNLEEILMSVSDN